MINCLNKWRRKAGFGSKFESFKAPCLCVKNNRSNNVQECIPVGCVPSATVAVCFGGESPHTHPPERGTTPGSRLPLEQAHPHWSRHPPGSRAPPEQAPPWSRHSLGADPPCCKACCDTTCNACWDSSPPWTVWHTHVKT